LEDKETYPLARSPDVEASMFWASKLAAITRSSAQ